ncbi:hypothetical protein [Enterobacter sp. PTB]|uniref:hypothetical protein n=1 Tax=Enterobacter sp. PTB TaxID=3143437 RepID=UPI003DAA0195
MKNTVSITLKGQRFELTCEELKQHVMACCDMGLVHFSAPQDGINRYVDQTRGFRSGQFYSGQRDASGGGNSAEMEVDY